MGGAGAGAAEGALGRLDARARLPPLPRVSPLLRALPWLAELLAALVRLGAARVARGFTGWGFTG